MLQKRNYSNYFISKIIWKNRLEWRNLLNSNEDIFQKTSSIGIAGIQITNTGKISASLGVAEINCFMKHANESQKEFYNKILQLDKIVALEYLFKITGAYEIWKRGIKKILLHENIIRNIACFCK